jgi:hypothetical protein
MNQNTEIIKVEIFDGEYISGWSKDNIIFIKFLSSGYLYSVKVNINREDGLNGFEYLLHPSEDDGEDFIICNDEHYPILDKKFTFKKFNNKVIQDSNRNYFLTESRDLNILKIFSENKSYEISESARQHVANFISYSQENYSMLIVPDKLNFYLSKKFEPNRLFVYDNLIKFNFSIDSFFKNDTHLNDRTIVQILKYYFSADLQEEFILDYHIGDLSKKKSLEYLLHGNLKKNLSIIYEENNILGNTNSSDCDFLIIGKSTADTIARILASKYKVIHIDSKEFAHNLIKKHGIVFKKLLYVFPQRFLYSHFKNL